MVNDPNYEKCAQCAMGIQVRDNHDEFYLCNAGADQMQCGGNLTTQAKVTLVAHTPDPLGVIEKAASMCYDSTSKKKGRIARTCYRSGHTSVFEHASFTFEITGVSRALLAQITRHRIASFSVRSQRYCDEDGFRVVMPPKMANNAHAAIAFRQAIEHSKDAYRELQHLGIANEDARFVLPNACETKMVMTMNVRELIAFCGLRLCTRAQWEIRQVAQQMVDCVREVAPEIAEYLRPKCERYAPYNFCTEDKSCGRHPTLAEVYDE